MTATRRDVVVVGGGQAGLAVGYHLARQGRRFTILEAASEPAASWRQRWDSLALFTPARYDALPGRPFPGDPNRYPGRDEVVDYLANYAEHFDLPVELDSRVERVRLDEGGYAVELADHTLHTAQVVIATGPFQAPFVPSIADDLAPDIVQMHSTEYRNPQQLPHGRILVVGGGNTGYQIAAELAASREVHLSIGSRQVPLPQRLLGRDLFRWLEATGLMHKTVDSGIGRRMKDRDTLIGSRPRTLRRQGVKLHGRATSAADADVTFEGGAELAFEAVVWATGFRLDHAWIDAPVFADSGHVEHTRGVTKSPGLYFLGLPWQHTRGSALIGWVKDDAEYVADRIAAFHETAPAIPLPVRAVAQPAT
jgi:putative flavoprotein involved in K+ transport